MSPPYSMVTQSDQQMNGNDAFEGFAIDLISEIAEILKFNYTFKWVDDGAYGFRNKETGEWNGLMGELLAQKADLAITDLTITYEREQAVDFSMPFMNLGISILYKKPQKKPPDLFSFLSPLSLDVWIYTAAAYLGVSILLFILARFNIITIIIVVVIIIISTSSSPGSVRTSGTTRTPARRRPRSWSTSSACATPCGSPSGPSCSRAVTSPPRRSRRGWWPACGGSSP